MIELKELENWYEMIDSLNDGYGVLLLEVIEVISGKKRKFHALYNALHTTNFNVCERIQEAILRGTTVGAWKNQVTRDECKVRAKELIKPMSMVYNRKHLDLQIHVNLEDWINKTIDQAFVLIKGFCQHPIHTVTLPRCLIYLIIAEMSMFVKLISIDEIGISKTI